MQIVHDGRVPFQVELQPVAHGDLGVIDVAIVVVVDVLAPVGGAGNAVLLVLLADLVVVVPIDVAVAAIRLGGIVEHDDDVAADLVVERGVLDGEPVGQFHEHFGRAGFGAVQAAGEHVDGLGLGDDAAGVREVEAARIGEFGEVAFIGVEVADVVFVGDGHYEALAAFVGGAGGEYFDAFRGCGKGPVVAAQIGYAGEFLGSADVVANDVPGAGNAGDPGKVIDERAHELGPGGPLLHQFGVVLVLRLPGLGKGGGPREVHRGQYEECEDTGGFLHGVARHWFTSIHQGYRAVPDRWRPPKAKGRDKTRYLRLSTFWFTKYDIEAGWRSRYTPFRVDQMISLVVSCVANNEAQDVVEYTMLLGFVVCMAAGLVMGLGNNINTVTSMSNSQLNAANALLH
ncbi:hypothetical protein SBA6_520026 [Candidatus Sulfopaludibacter sp. SbA6]|nr:hypothetical protein SBA6_520026 [Candidatus Sulfopaludibacter sp. SbA6]